MFTEENIRKYYKEIQSQTDLNLEKKQSWGFYFKSKNLEELENAKKIFLEKKYDYAETINDEGIYYLQIEKKEINDIKSLYKRCVELKNLAESLNIDEFNGFDVEPYIV